jgi:hypothetical protein
MTKDETKITRQEQLRYHFPQNFAEESNFSEHMHRLAPKFLHLHKPHNLIALCKQDSRKYKRSSIKLLHFITGKITEDARVILEQNHAPVPK